VNTLFGTQRTRLISAAIVLVVLIAGAWAIELVARRAGAASDYRISVVRDGQVLRSFDLKALAKLPSHSAVMQGQKQQGPSLLDVLAEAGVEDFTVVTVIGQGVRDDGVIELSRAEVGENVLLDLAARGTMKLCGPDISWDDRVRDVERIEVR